MEDLIKAFQIFLKYSNAKWPTCCEHDVLYVHVDAELVSDKDIEILEELGFTISDEFGNKIFLSFRFGSC